MSDESNALIVQLRAERDAARAEADELRIDRDALVKLLLATANDRIEQVTAVAVRLRDALRDMTADHSPNNPCPACRLLADPEVRAL